MRKKKQGLPDDMPELKRGAGFRAVWKRFCRNKLAVVGLVIFLVILFFAIFRRKKHSPRTS